MASALPEEMTQRQAGYAGLRSYAAIGDGRTVALVANDGAVDWLALPNLDSPTVFAALLDEVRGGCFTLAPTERFKVARRYLPGTDVLETTFTTTGGVARVLDAMSMRSPALGPLRELQRRVQGLAGRVHMAWCVRPRFGYGERPTRLVRRIGVPVATSGRRRLSRVSLSFLYPTGTR